VTTRYLETAALAEITSRSHVDPEIASLILTCLQSTAPELVAVHEVKPADMLPVYETRRDRWLTGDGPNIIGIEQFVEALPSLPGSVAGFGIGKDEWRALVLLDLDVTQILAALVIDRREVQPGRNLPPRRNAFDELGKP
jgi:hypothetical protein